MIIVKFTVQSESVTLSVDYLISSTQAGTIPAWVFYSPYIIEMIVAGIISHDLKHYNFVFFSIDIRADLIL